MMCTPRSDMIQNLGFQKLITSTYATNSYGTMMDLPDLCDVPPAMYNDVLRKKLHECCVICSFDNSTTDNKNKATKTKYLNEILDQISNNRSFQLIDQTSFDELFKMIKSNIIRAIPPVPPLAKVPIIGEDINDTLLESAWPHLDLVYQIFGKFLESPQMNANQHVKRFDNTFLTQFFLLFDTSDPRERETLKAILHRIYLKFNMLRPKMRLIMQNIFLTFIYETHFFSGINELLGFHISIINGFSVPIKPENVNFLMKVLLPLHTSIFFHQFQENLFYCVMQFVDKDQRLVPQIIRKLIKLWPSTSIKQLLFLAELMTLIDSLSEDQFKEIGPELMQKIGESVESPNFQVSESAILMWRNDNFVMQSAVNASVLFPIIVPFLYRAGSNHWNPAIKNIAISVLRICMQTCPEVYDKVSKNIRELESLQIKKSQMEGSAWADITQQALENDPHVKLVPKPLPPDVIFQAPE